MFCSIDENVHDIYITAYTISYEGKTSALRNVWPLQQDRAHMCYK